MTLHELRFGKIIAISEHIAEIIIDDELELDEFMVEECHQLLKSYFKAPILLLVNKINRYTYTLAAQRKFAVIPEIIALSVVVYNRITELSTVALISIPRASQWNVRIFYNRKKAIEWLESIQAEHSNKNQITPINLEITSALHVTS